MTRYGFDKICANADMDSGSDHRPEYQGYLAQFRDKTVMTDVAKLFKGEMETYLPELKPGEVQYTVCIEILPGFFPE